MGSDFHVDLEVISTGAGRLGRDVVDSFIVASIVRVWVIWFSAFVTVRGCLT